ncbi:MAG TPA: M20/M25/M40 family metallo-hydrolase [Thermotogota bacterium]|jgi:endoglucanase|nr:M20/M25/M40 family metallo-hydrolase [Thermotogota bacterium]NLH18774.1 M42 family metallopeptidase [Thermotogaceae bacterium]OQC31802.1 MAG: putative aminopeptidase YsdC [Thermotogota bacterium ADurb.Bin062]HNW46734.1 M20/M25/M40 family metallo-hydrolase [Thermotogota bacterium]HNY81717.1 M20/M25/M40 family metallo-hydrolase [Thermotogota bacterium]
MFLKDLCEINGASGNEDRVRSYIQEQLKSPEEPGQVDVLGNLFFEKKGNGTSDKTILLMAHTDEVGLMVTNIQDDGLLAVSPIGGVDPRVLLGKRVWVGENNLPGVIGYKAIHLQKEDFKTLPDWDKVRVDIGAQKKEEAQKSVNLGDYVHFYSPFEEYENRYVGKALDDRAGCALLMALYRELPVLNHRVVFAFVVQEEIGLRGSGSTLKRYKPDAAIVVEGTTAGDNPELKRERWSTHLDNGPAISYLQSGYALDYRLFEAIVAFANQKGILYQLKGRTVGGTDGTRLASTYFGVPCAGVNIPSRYIHSPVSVISKKDFENTKQFIADILTEEILLKALEVKV